MRSLYDVPQIRAAEEQLLAVVPDGALMAQAAAGLARRCADLLGRVYGARVVLLVGSGNNGGDALYAGALLARRGAAVQAVVVGQTPHVGGLAALRSAGGRVVTETESAVAAADLVIDGLVGIGATGALREPAATLARLLAGSQAVVVAVDVPSGVDASSGEVHGDAVRADVTVTFGGLKAGLLVSPGAGFAGLVELVQIGLDLPEPAVTALDAADVAALLPTPTGEASKYTRGVVGVVTGSQQYTGAAVLSTGGALRAGAGMVRFVGVPHASDQVRARWPEVVVTEVVAGDDGQIADPARIVDAGRVQAWAFGSGHGRGSIGVAETLLGTDLPVLVDADALTALADRHALLRRSAGTLITPHAGEFARLMHTDRDDVEAHRLSWARRAADELGVTVLLKGSTTVVADPDGRTAVNTTATAWLGTAGSGDVLSGVCGSLLAQGLSPFDAGRVGAFLHGLAGQLASHGAPLVAADLLDVWPDVERTVRAVVA
ncbi:bifunctional ADP-dependent NAD(P)H-hydrate dehydratase/NAD(P)H-hydrate epimerase [Acidothermaceae bacterium B102]|nr:bifunctional ADP-dependent NAD(P)H-hydrate dehydratase/NAD(P)H-hydrate epimerase [Acidothermaceae bacterium B102]